MLEALFPGWSNPAVLAALVALRISVNGLLVAVVAATVGRDAPATAVSAGAALCSAVLVVTVLRPGGPGLNASYVELLAQLVVLGCAGYAAYSSREPRRALALGLVGALALLLGLYTIPIYGEAFVAP